MVSQLVEREDASSGDREHLVFTDHSQVFRLFVTTPPERIPDAYQERIIEYLHGDGEALHGSMASLVRAREQGDPDGLIDIVLHRAESLKEIRKARDPEILAEQIRTWNKALREVSAASVLNHWSFFKEAATLPEAEVIEALRVVDARADLFASDGPSIRAALGRVRRQYSTRAEQYGSNDVFCEFEQAALTVIRGLDLPRLLTEPLRRAITGNTRANEVVNLIEVWEGLEDPFASVSPDVEQFALDIARSCRFFEFVPSGRWYETFRSFAYTIQMLHIAATNSGSAWSQLDPKIAQGMLTFMAEGTTGWRMTEELLFLLDHGKLISPYQILAYSRKYGVDWESNYELTAASGFIKELFNMPYSVTSYERATEFDTSVLFPDIDTAGMAIDIGSSIPLCLLERCRSMNWQGPQVSVDRYSLTDDLRSESLVFRYETGPRMEMTQDEQASIQDQLEHPNATHRVATLPRDLPQFMQWVDRQRAKVTFYQDQAFSGLYLSPPDRLSVRRALLSRLADHGYAVMTRRFTGYPYRLNDMIVGKKNGRYFVRAVEEKSSAIGDQTLRELFAYSRFLDRGIELFRPTGRKQALPPASYDELTGITSASVHAACRAWMESVSAAGMKLWKGEEKEAIAHCLARSVLQAATIIPPREQREDYKNIGRAVVDDYWDKKPAWAEEQSRRTWEMLARVRQGHPYVYASLTEYLALSNHLALSPHVINISRSIQGPQLLPIASALPHVSTRVGDPASLWKAFGYFNVSVVKDYEFYLNAFSSAHGLPDRVSIGFHELLSKRGFTMFPSASLLYDRDSNMYVLSLGRAEIEPLLLHVITGMRDGRLVRELLGGEQERMAGFQVCLRHRDVSEVAFEATNSSVLKSHASLFWMYGYFLLSEKGRTEPFEVISPVWEILMDQGLLPERFWAVVDPKDAKFKSLLRKLGIPKEHIVEDAGASIWRQGGSPNPDLGGNLTGRNFELFYELPHADHAHQCSPQCSCGETMELVNVINITGIDGQEKRLRFDVYEVAMGFERLQMAVESQQQGKAVPITGLWEFTELEKKIREKSRGYSGADRDLLVSRLLDAQRAVNTLIDCIANEESKKYPVYYPDSFGKIARQARIDESRYPRYRRVAQPIFTETVSLYRLLGIPLNSARSFSWHSGEMPQQHTLHPSGAAGPVHDEFMKQESDRLDAVLVTALESPSGPLYMALRETHALSVIEQNRDVLGEEYRVRFGVPRLLSRRLWGAAQDLSHMENSPSIQDVNTILQKRLGFEEVPAETSRRLLDIVQKERQRRYPPLQTFSPFRVVSKRITPTQGKGNVSPCALPVQDPTDGEPAIDASLVIERAARKLAEDLPKLLPLLRIDGDMAIIGLGNGSTRQGTPHNMGADVVTALRRALGNRQEARFPNGTLRFLTNESDMNCAGEAIASQLLQSDERLSRAILVADDSRAHVGSWSPTQQSITKVIHRGVQSVVRSLGNIPLLPVGTFTSDQRGDPAGNLLRRYGTSHEQELIDALVLYAKRALLAFT